MQERWQRIDAEHWVGVLGMLQTSMLAFLTAWTLLAGLVMAGPLVAVVAAAIPGALTALVGWMTAAWRREKPWSWVAWTILSCLDVLRALAWIVGSGPGWADGLALGVGALTLVLLVHPDARERLVRLSGQQLDTAPTSRTL